MAGSVEFAEPQSGRWQQILDTPACLEDILITDQLKQRGQRMPQPEEENRALRAVAKAMHECPEQLADMLLGFAMRLCGAGTAGISLLETDESGAQIFRWTNLAGAYKPYVGGHTPRNFSPCGVTMDRRSPQLFSFPGRYFEYFKPVQPPLVEGLVLPIPECGEKIHGTIWVVSHHADKKFDREDVRLMTSLAEFTCSAMVLTQLLRAERTARQEAEVRVEKGLEVLRMLSNRLLQSQDQERRRIARNLHDSVGQHLVSVKMNLDTMETANPAKLAELLRDTRGAVTNAMSEIRTLSHLLHPPLLDEAGLIAAITPYIEEFSRRSGLPVSLEIPDEFPRLPERVELTLFRILQEALTNVHRHSESSNASIALNIDAESVCMTISDDGRGVPPEVLDGFEQGGDGVGVGLAGMRERVNELKGKLRLASSENGTVLSAVLPLDPNSSAKFAAKQ